MTKARGMKLRLSFSVPKGVQINSEVRVAGYSITTDKGKYMTPDDAESALDEFVDIAKRTITALRAEEETNPNASNNG